MPLSPWRLRLLIISLLTVSFLGALDHTVVATSLATITGELGAVEQMSWVIVSYTLASTVLLPVLGKLADLVGARLIFLSSLALFLVASLFCGLAQDITQLALARVAQGIGSAGLHLMPQTIVGEVTSPRERPRVLSLIGAAFPIAILVGPLAGGLITDAWGWRWVFWINIPVGMIALALAVVAVPHIAGRSGRRFDIAGAVVLGVTVTAFVLAAGWASAGADGSGPLVVIAALVAIIGLAAFIAIELRVSEPVVPLRHFANRTILVCIVLSTVIGVGLFSVVSYVPTFIQMAYGTSATVSGLVPIATVFGMLVSTLVTGSLASRTGRYRIFPIFGTTAAAVGLLVMALLPAGMPLWVPMLAMGLVGIGTGSFMNIIVAVAQSAAPRSDTGSVTATVSLVRQVGSTTATAIVGGLIGAGVTLGLPGLPGCRDPHAAGGRGGVARRPDPGRGAVLERAGPDLRRTCDRLRGRHRRGIAAPARAAVRRARRRTPDRGRDGRRVTTRRREEMSQHPTIAIVGSGPIGSAYARVLVEGLPDARVVMFEAGPQLTAIPGESVRNIPDPAEKERARELSQGPQAGALRESLGIPAGVVVEGMFTARQGTHLLDFGGEGSASAPSFPAAAAATNVGGQGAHWTCATPSPSFSEKIPFIPDDEWDDLLAVAKDLLHVQSAAFADSGWERASGRCSRRTTPVSCRRATGPARFPSPATRSPTGRCGGPVPTSCSARSSMRPRRSASGSSCAISRWCAASRSSRAL